MSADTGHGHVTPRKDGVRARCGGPAMCSTSQREEAAAARGGPCADPVSCAASLVSAWDCAHVVAAGQGSEAVDK